MYSKHCSSLMLDCSHSRLALEVRRLVLWLALYEQSWQLVEITGFG